jgi:hypothetical protein
LAEEPSDVEFDDRKFSDGGLYYVVTVLAADYQAANSVTDGIFPAPDQTTGVKGRSPDSSCAST